MKKETFKLPKKMKLELPVIDVFLLAMYAHRHASGAHDIEDSINAGGKAMIMEIAQSIIDEVARLNGAD